MRQTRRKQQHDGVDHKGENAKRKYNERKGEHLDHGLQNSVHSGKNKGCEANFPGVIGEPDTIDPVGGGPDAQTIDCKPN